MRQVEYKDKMDEEWELFTRAMKEQSVVRDDVYALSQIMPVHSDVCVTAWNGYKCIHKRNL